MYNNHKIDIFLTDRKQNNITEFTISLKQIKNILKRLILPNNILQNLQLLIEVCSIYYFMEKNNGATVNNNI